MSTLLGSVYYLPCTPLSPRAIKPELVCFVGSEPDFFSTGVTGYLTWSLSQLNFLFSHYFNSTFDICDSQHFLSSLFPFHLPRYLCFLLFQSMYHFYLYVVNTFSLSLGIYLFALCLLNYVGISTSIYVYPCLYIYVCTSMTIYLCIFMCISLSMSSSGNSMTCMFTNVFCFSAFRSLSLHLSCVSYFTLFV